MAKKKDTDKKVANRVAKLSHFLADTTVLYFKTLNFHWNMVGEEFYMFHKLLEEQYKDLAVAMDDVAERIRQIGYPAPGSMAEMLKLAFLKENDKQLTQQQMIKTLAADHDDMVTQCHYLISFFDESEDPGSSDLIVDRLRAHDKIAWLLKSHLQK